MNPVLQQLRGGDRRSVHGVPQLVRQVLADRSLFSVVFAGMSDDDPLVRMRCSDAIEKITVQHPEYLAPYRKRLIQLAEEAEQQEVRWHMAQLLSRIEWNESERRRVLRIMAVYLKDPSSIVKTFAMQTMADMAAQDSRLCAPIVEKLKRLTRDGTPAMKSRGRRLLARLERD
jgi:hypothetical protein